MCGGHSKPTCQSMLGTFRRRMRREKEKGSVGVPRAGIHPDKASVKDTDVDTCGLGNGTQVCWGRGVRERRAERAARP